MGRLRKIHVGLASIIGIAAILIGVLVVSIGAQAMTSKPAWSDPALGCRAHEGDACLVLVDGEQDQSRRQLQTGVDHAALLGHDGTAVSVLGDCAACHRDDPVLPEGHVATVGMPLAHCRTCHTPQSDLSLAGLLPLDHTHALAGFGCASCHDTTAAAMREPKTETCLSCHGSLDDIAAQTADVSPTNPHSSPHGSPYAECALCHMQHQASENFCATCHDFEFDLP